MKIYGPYTRKDGRMHLVIVNDGKTTTISYPKYIMQQKLGRPLSPDETVDHIDGNPFNNNPENFQILTRRENALKSTKYAEYLTLVCKCCNKQFKRKKCIHVRNMAVRKTDGPFCSKSCVGKIHH